MFTVSAEQMLQSNIFISPSLDLLGWMHAIDLPESVQLVAARVVTGALSHTSHSKIYAEIGWETLAERQQKHKLTIMYKIVNGFAPTYLRNLILQTVTERTRYNILSRHLLVPSMLEQIFFTTLSFRLLYIYIYVHNL